MEIIRRNYRNSKNFLKLKIGGYILIPFGLLFLPVDFFDNGKTVCLSVLLAGQNCYACGMTRGIMHLIHLDFTQAAEFNKLSFIVLPLIIFVWIRGFFNDFKKIKSV